MTEFLRWSDGKRSKAEGTDFASVASRLPDDDLRKWLTVFRERPLYHERCLLEAEAAKRFGVDHNFGPLFATGASHG